jgi:hypothetical protein
MAGAKGLEALRLDWDEWHFSFRMGHVVFCLIVVIDCNVLGRGLTEHVLQLTMYFSYSSKKQCTFVTIYHNVKCQVIKHTLVGSNRDSS